MDTTDGRPDPKNARNFNEEAEVVLLSVGLGVVMSDAIASIEVCSCSPQKYSQLNEVDSATPAQAVCARERVA